MRFNLFLLCFSSTFSSAAKARSKRNTASDAGGAFNLHRLALQFERGAIQQDQIAIHLLNCAASRFRQWWFPSAMRTGAENTRIRLHTRRHALDIAATRHWHVFRVFLALAAFIASAKPP